MTDDKSDSGSQDVKNYVQGLLEDENIETGLYDGELFAITPSWRAMSNIVKDFNHIKKEDLLNYGCSKEGLEGYWKNINKFADLRLGSNGRAPMDDGKPCYVVPEELKDFDDILEIIGVKDWGFSDEYNFCYGCHNVLRTSPDCWAWTPDFYDNGELLLCMECFDEDEYINDVKNKPHSCNLVDPLEHGYVKIDENFAAGMIEGHNDNPKKILELLNEQDIDVLFYIYPSQFTVEYDVFVPEDKLETAQQLLSQESIKYPYGQSPADICKRGLEEATRKIGELQDEGIKYAKIKADGTADVKILSNEEFIEGIKD